MDLMQSLAVSSSGMAAQSARMKVIAENIANADSVVGENGEPYRRQQLFFQSIVDKESGMTHVEVSDIKKDTKSPFRTVYDPGHELANEDGFVQFPNVNTFAESTDMRDAVRVYEANMSAVESAKEMMVRSLDLIR